MRCSSIDIAVLVWNYGRGLLQIFLWKLSPLFSVYWWALTPLPHPCLSINPLLNEIKEFKTMVYQLAMMVQPILEENCIELLTN